MSSELSPQPSLESSDESFTRTDLSWTLALVMTLALLIILLQQTIASFSAS